MKHIRVAVTGGIGSGKSLVGEYFFQAGYPVLKADNIAKDLMQTDSGLKKKIISEFGSDSYNGDLLNTKYLAANVFSDPEKLEKINSIVHPATIKMIEQETRKLFNEHKIVFVESALVFEAKIRKMFDYIILVTAEEKTRIERIVKRDHIAEEKVTERIKFQIEDEKKKQLCDFVIDNDAPKAEIGDKCKFVLQILKSFVG